MPLERRDTSPAGRQDQRTMPAARECEHALGPPFFRRSRWYASWEGDRPVGGHCASLRQHTASGAATRDRAARGWVRADRPQPKTREAVAHRD